MTTPIDPQSAESARRPADNLTMPGDRRFMLVVRYDGHEFHGWQKQHPPDCDPLRTAQGVLEDAVRRAVREPISILGASRTDSGVHAEGQVAAFNASSNMRVPIERLHLAINRHLPTDIAVVHAREVAVDFDPIGGAIEKCYRYTIHNSDIKPVFDRHRVFHCWYQLDLAKMNNAAQMLVGEHDFASFANTHHGRESTVRTVNSCVVHRDPARDDRILIDITGSGFLYHMVRIVTGTLVEVGRGHWTPDDLRTILESRNRAAAGPTAPPEGLCLKWVRHE